MFSTVIFAPFAKLPSTYFTPFTAWSTFHLLKNQPLQNQLSSSPDTFSIVWKKSHGGPAYIIYALIAREEGGVICAKKFVTISPKTGEIFPCYREHQTYDWGYWKHIKTLIDTPKDCEMTSIAVASCLGFYSDRKYLWNVAATEDGERKATFGVYEAQIKSLFYSRSAPNTSIGRKRPILHWVRSHTRRMKSGIDVDIEKHLRGVDRFEMGNTVFHITRPTKVHQNVGK